MLLVLSLLLSSLTVDSLSDLHGRSIHSALGRDHGVSVIRVQGVLGLVEVSEDLVLGGLIELVLVLVEGLSGLEEGGVELVLGVNSSLGMVSFMRAYSLGLVSLFRSLGILDHLVDLILGETSRWLDGDGLLLSSGLVLGRDLHDTVVINLKVDLNLWNSSKI